MLEVSIIWLDIAKHVFQAHGVDSTGHAVLRKKISCAKLLPFFAAQPRCRVVLEACGGAHHWARELIKLGHDVQLIAPAYVKPFVKRQKNDAADAEAICEAAQRPSMRFVPVKSKAQQSAAMVFRGRDLLVRQRTQISNALRSHMAEYGWIAPKGLVHLDQLAALIADPAAVPDGVRSVCVVLLDSLAVLDRQIALLDHEIARRARENEAARRLMTIPGVGPITATAIAALAPPPGTFAKGRDFAAWVGLTPRQHSTGGTQKLGAISKMGERTLRRLLIIGASAVYGPVFAFSRTFWPSRGMGASFVFNGVLALTSLIAADPTSAAPSPAAILPIPTADAIAPTPEEILVTGERVNRRLRDSASSVVVFRADTIDALAVADRLDVLLPLVPNLQSGSGSDAPTIRGQDSTGVLNNLPAFLGGARPRATLQIDGRPASFNEFVFGIASLWDVAQVEIFRSPQTTTQGRNAIAGGLFISTADPVFDWHVRGRLAVGLSERRQASAMLTGPLAGDQLAFRLSGDIQRDMPASYITPLMRGADPNLDRQSLLRFKLLASPHALPGARFTLSLAHTDGQSPQVVGLTAPFRARRDASPGYGIFRRRVDSASVIATVPITSWLTSTTTITTSRSRFRRFAIPGLGEARTRIRDMSVESLLAWHPLPTLRLSGGVNWLTSGLRQYIDLSQFARFGRFSDRQRGIGVFGEGEWHPAPRITLVAGFRYEHDIQRRIGLLTKPSGPAALDYNGAFTAWLPKASLAYAFSDGLTAGLLVQKAYNAGGATLTLLGVTDTFAAETLWDYEVFARGSLAGGRLRYTANAFANRIRNAQRQQVELVTLPNGIKVENVEFGNAPRARSKGIELAFEWRANDRFRLQFGLGLLDTKITRTLDPADPIAGRQFARSPNVSGSAAINWQPTPNLQISAQLRAHGRYFSDDKNSRSLRVGAAALVDTRASFDLGRASVALYARNLFDRFAMTYLFNPSFGTAEDPRRVGVELEAHF